MTTHKMGKDLHPHTSERGLISKIFKELKKLSIKNRDNQFQNLNNILNRLSASQMTEKRLKISIPLVIRKLRIKTALMVHFAPGRIGMIKTKSDCLC